MDKRRSVLLADAGEEFRAMTREVIEKTEEFTVVGACGDGAEGPRGEGSAVRRHRAGQSGRLFRA